MAKGIAKFATHVPAFAIKDEARIDGPGHIFDLVEGLDVKDAH